MPPEKDKKVLPRDKAISFKALMEGKTLKPLPAVTVIAGNADFLKGCVVQRLTKELFEGRAEEVSRFQAPAKERGGEDLSAATVLDELQTPSFFNTHRLVVVERAETFLSAHGESLLPYLEKGFSGGHLLLVLEDKLDARTKFAKSVANSPTWIVECTQPYDRPPPWDRNTPAWDSALSHWIVGHAKGKGLEMSPQVAFFFHERAGTDLAVIDEELEKIATLLASRGSKRVDENVIQESVGDLREDSVFQAIELFLQGKRAEVVEAIQRLFTRGYHNEKGGVTTEPTTIALLFLGALLPRLRALRRAHAMELEGSGPNEWIAAGIVTKPFIVRFEKQLKALSPRKLVRLIDKLYEVDKQIKSGAPAQRLIELLVVEFGAASPS